MQKIKNIIKQYCCTHDEGEVLLVAVGYVGAHVPRDGVGHPMTRSLFVKLYFKGLGAKLLYLVI